MDKKHYNSLENMYLAAPVNKIFPPRITIGNGEAEIEIDLKPEYHHTAGAVHGSVYFKLLDDAAFFAANSLEKDVFVLTTSFTTYITKPVVDGVMRSVGRVVNSNRTQWIAESIVYDSNGREIARGNGIFVRGKTELQKIPAYKCEYKTV